MKVRGTLYAILTTIMLQACANSKAVVSRGIDLSKYSYVVFGQESTGNSGLDDMIIAVQNEIADTELEVVSAQNGRVKMSLGESVLSPNIHILSENHDGGHTYITITFYDCNTSQKIAVVKSSGIGMSISQDQNIALSSIRKKLKNLFGNKR